MLHELDKFYNTDLSFLTITFGQKRIVPYVFMTMHILLSIASLICWFSKILFWSYVFITMFILTTILYFWRAKKNLKKYNIRTAFIPDFYHATRELRIERMKNFLISNDLTRKCDKLVEALQRKADSSKISPIFNTGIFLLLVLPIWEQMVIQLAGSVNIFQLKNIIWFLNFTVIIYFVIWIIKFIKDSILELLDIQSQKYVVMIDLIEEISLNE